MTIGLPFTRRDNHNNQIMELFLFLFGQHFHDWNTYLSLSSQQFILQCLPVPADVTPWKNKNFVAAFKRENPLESHWIPCTKEIIELQ